MYTKMNVKRERRLHSLESALSYRYRFYIFCLFKHESFYISLPLSDMKKAPSYDRNMLP
jgi:hypothetical protein